MKRAYGLCRGTVCFLGGFALTALLGLCLTGRAVVAQNVTERVTLEGQPVMVWFLFAGLSALLLLARRMLECTPEKALYAVGVLTYALAGAWLILHADGTVRADVYDVFRSAAAVNAGDYSVLGTGEYMGLYPHQLGLMSLYRPFAAGFPDGRGLFWGNLVCVLAANTLMWRLCAVWFAQQSMVRKYALLLGFLFLPQLFLVLFPYGLVPGTVLTLAAALCMAHVLRSTPGWRRGVYILGTVMCSALAVAVRNNCMIGVLALMAVCFLSLLREKRVSRLALLLLLAAAMVVPGRVLHARYEAESGMDIGGGIPKLLWVAMGMQEGPRGNGWYNVYTVAVYKQNGYDAQIAQQIARQDISARLQEFAADPDCAVAFYVDKLRSTWCEPTFQSVWSGPLPDSGQQTSSAFLQGLYGGGEELEYVRRYCGALELCLLLFAAAGLLRLWREGMERDDLLFPVIFLLGGILFHLLWETKSQYVSGYVFLLIPLAALGADWLSRAISARENSDN